MYRVLIVDDEPEIRQGLRLKIEAEQLGLELSGEAANGIEALERLEEEAFDIVLTDMNMPAMDGVIFMEACRGRYPDLRLIVVTGYDDFQYARAALRHQAIDYLLKPVARDELAAVLRKAIAELDAERSASASRARAQWELSQYYKEMKEHFIVRLVKGEMDGERALYDRAGKFGLDSWGKREIRFLTVGFRKRAAAGSGDPRRTPDQFRLPLELICREQADASGGSCETFRDANYPGLIHFLTPESAGWLRDFAEELRRQAQKLIGFELAIGYGQSVVGFGQWKEGYLSALLAWNLAESGAAAGDRVTIGPPALSEEEIKLVERCLSRGEPEAFEQAVRQLLQQAFGTSKARFVKAIFQLYLLLEPLAYEARIPMDGSEHLWLQPELALTLDSVDKAAGFLAGIAGKIARRRRSELEEGEPSLIEAARRYIDDNYMSDLNLTEIAERFNYNPSYFSEMFKNKVGKTFIQYLTETRMAQAVRLLEGTQLGLWDIAELTGFSNASYFSSKFKKLFGMTPSDYRQKVSAKDRTRADGEAGGR